MDLLELTTLRGLMDKVVTEFDQIVLVGDSTLYFDDGQKKISNRLVAPIIFKGTH